MGDPTSVEDELELSEDENEAYDGEDEDTPSEVSVQPQPTPTHPSSNISYEYIETEEESARIDLVTGILNSLSRRDPWMRQQIRTMLETPWAADGLYWRLFGVGTKKVVLENGEIVTMIGNDPNHPGQPSRHTYPNSTIANAAAYVDQRYGHGGW